MQEIINKVLEVEQGAEKMIRQARDQAAEIRSRAEAEAEQKLQAARKEAGSKVQEAVAEAREQSRQRCEQALESARAENRAFLDSREQSIARAVEAVIEVLGSPEWSSS